MSDDELTRDPILRGRLHLWQPRAGYRFAVDPLLLAHFVLAGPLARERAPRVVDLGTGSGIVALLVAQAHAGAQVTAVELQPRLAGLARRNVADNGLAARVEVRELDIADRGAMAALPGASADQVVSNPPYRPVGTGGVNPDPEEAIARHELRLTLPQLVAAARRLLVPDGRVAFVFPADRTPALLAALAAERLTPLRLRLVHDRPDAPASLVLVEARKSPRGVLVVEPPFILRDAAGAWTAEARTALGEDAPS